VTTSSAARFCALGDGAVSPITSGIKYFRQEFLDLCKDQPTVPRQDQHDDLVGSPVMTLTQDSGTGSKERPVPEGYVRLTIDGVEVDAPKGEILIRACERLRHHRAPVLRPPAAVPAGACRQCLVEVEMGGRPMPKPQASCTMTVADGMVVKTQHTSKVADKAQQGVMELLPHQPPAGLPDSATRAASARCRTRR